MVRKTAKPSFVITRELRSLGRLRSLREPLLAKSYAKYLRTHTGELDLAGEIERWREDLLQYGIEQLTGDSGDQKD